METAKFNILRYLPTNSTTAASSSGAQFFAWFRISVASLVHDFSLTWANGPYSKRISQTKRQKLQIFSPRPRVGTDTRGSHIAALILCLYQKMSQLIFTFFKTLIAYNFHQSGLIIYLSYKFIYLFFLPSVIRRPPSTIRNGTQYNSTLFMLTENVNGFAKKVTNLIVFIVNTNFNCRNCMLICNIRY